MLLSILSTCETQSAANLFCTDPSRSVKTRLQVQIRRKDIQTVPTTTDHHQYEHTLDAIKKIVEHEGITGLYSGISGSLIGVASTNFAYFYWYSVVRTLYTSTQKVPKPPSTAIELSLGAVAGAIAQIFTIPVAVVTTRQQTQPRGEKKGLLDTAREVIDSEDGWSGLWRGLKASLVLVVNPAITYGAYQRLRDMIYPGRLALKPHEAFCKSIPLLTPPSHSCSFFHLPNLTPTVLGALSKSLATLATQPLIVAKVGLQSRPPPAREGKPFKSFIEVMEYIIEHEGPLALFKGIAPQLLKGLFVQGLLMMTKERMELLFVLLFAYVREIRRRKVEQALQALKEKAGPMMDQGMEGVRGLVPVTIK